MSAPEEPAVVVARFQDAVSSGDPDGIARGLDELRDLPLPRERIPAPTPEILDAFGDDVPGEVVRNYIWVLSAYRPYDPPVSSQTIIQWSVESVLRSADFPAALQIVLALRHDDLPEGTDVGDVLAYVARRGVQPGVEARGAEALAQNFLDHSQTYERAVPALTAWIGQPVLGDVLKRLANYVRPEDRPALGL